MDSTFKVLVGAAELSRPRPDRGAARNSRRCSTREGLLRRRGARAALTRLIAEIAAGDLYDLQERYVPAVRPQRTLSLHLFEHVHGESRDRGQAMVDLKALYEAAGLEIAANELPDYVPLFLEFLSTRPLAEARELLGQPAHILAALAERLGAAPVELQGGVRRAGRDRGGAAAARRSSTSC